MVAPILWEMFFKSLSKSGEANVKKKYIAIFLLKKLKNIGFDPHGMGLFSYNTSLPGINNHSTYRMACFWRPLVVNKITETIFLSLGPFNDKKRASLNVDGPTHRNFLEFLYVYI